MLKNTQNHVLQHAYLLEKSSNIRYLFVSLRYIKTLRDNIMSGFSHDLEPKEITSKLYRKVNFENITNSGELCTSTENSVKLIGTGEVCYIFDSKKRTGMYDDKDADAGKNFGYDEFRTEIDLTEECPYIVYPNSWDEIIETITESDERFDTDEDPMVWIYNLEELSIGQVISERDYRESTKDTIDFNW